MGKGDDESCPPHQLLRRGYSTKTGKKVKPTCIQATSVHNKRATDVTDSITTKLLASQHIARKHTTNASPKTCPKATILRTAYMRTSSTGKQSFVPAQCIQEQGKRDGKVGLYGSKTGERVYIHLETDLLSRNGYHKVKNLAADARHAALDRAYAASQKNWLSVFRTLNYLAVLNKSNPKLHTLFLADRNYVKHKYAPK